MLGSPTPGAYLLYLEGAQGTSVMFSWKITRIVSTGNISMDTRESWLATGLPK